MLGLNQSIESMSYVNKNIALISNFTNVRMKKYKPQSQYVAAVGARPSAPSLAVLVSAATLEAPFLQSANKIGLVLTRS